MARIRIENNDNWFCFRDSDLAVLLNEGIQTIFRVIWLNHSLEARTGDQTIETEDEDSTVNNIT